MEGKSYLKCRQEDSVLELSLADDSTRNAVSEGLCKELLDRLEQAVADRKTKVVILSAQGEYFCSGGDFKAFINSDENIADQVSRTIRDFFNPVVRSIRELPMPVIAAVLMRTQDRPVFLKSLISSVAGRTHRNA